MDLWKMRLRAASFRGVPFGVTADESEGGRRTVTHEFPQRETPYVEDLGGAPRRFTVQAFVPMDLLDGFKKEMERVLGDGSCHVLSIRAEGGIRID